MKTSALLVLSSVFALSCIAGADEQIVWQLGVEDNSSSEFLPYSNRELAANPELWALPGFKRDARAFEYKVNALGKTSNPKFPAGISAPGPAAAYISEESVSWKDSGDGFRVLEMHIIDSKLRNFAQYRVTPNENMDLDSMESARYDLRIALPGGQVVRVHVPYDIEAYIKEKGEIVIRAGFKPVPGANTISLKEDSGHTYGRCMHFDYIKVMRSDSPLANAPVLELSPKSGFMAGSVYDANSAAAPELAVKAFNLPPGKPCSVDVRFLDFFDNEIAKQSQEAKSGIDGSVSLNADVPTGIRGHIRAFVSVSIDGKPLALHDGKTERMLRMASVRKIAEPSDEEIEKAFVGLSGIPSPFLFDPNDDMEACKDRVRLYWSFRSALQIFNERAHSLPWPFLEKEQGKFRWEFWDWMINGEKERRTRLQVTIMGTPKWLAGQKWPEREANIWQWMFSCPPDMNAWANVCGKLAERYKDSIADIEIWNEPSEHSIFWYKANAEDYFNLVKTASEAIRNVAPNINVAAETVWSRQEDFTRKLYDMGIAKYVDYPADHYMDDRRISAAVRYLAEVGTGKGLISNESKCDMPDRNGRGQVDLPSEKSAARALIRNMVHQNAAGVKRIYNFELLSLTWRLYGNVGPDNTPKFSFSALKTLVNRSMGAEFRKTLDLGVGVEAQSYRYFDPKRVKENGSDNVLFLFNASRGKTQRSIFVGVPEVTLIDIMDNERKQKTENGVLSVELDEIPLMVAGASTDALDAQSALSLSCLSSDVAPGSTVEIAASFNRNASSMVKSATITLDASKISSASIGAIELAPGDSKRIRIPLRGNLEEGRYVVSATTVLQTAQGAISLPKSFIILVSRTQPGENILGSASKTFSAGSDAWMKWGDTKLSYKNDGPNGSPSAKIDVAGTGGFRFKEDVALIESAKYHVSLVARGSGTLRVMLVKKYKDGKTNTEHNFISGSLSDSWKEFHGDFVAPPGIGSAELNLYEFKESASFEIASPLMTRLQPGVSANRILFKAAANPAGQLDLSKIESWPSGWFTQFPDSGVKISGYGGAKDLSASFASAWRGQTLFFLVKVEDDKHVGGDSPDLLWKVDSLQMDFEPTFNAGQSESAQFSFGSVAGKPVAYRQKIVPCEDIVPTYRTGAHPAGVSVKTLRDGTTSCCLVSIDAGAIWPKLRLEQGKRIAFSVLVNDNDGNGRKGWIEWSSGIGSSQNSTLFGTLELK